MITPVATAPAWSALLRRAVARPYLALGGITLLGLLLRLHGLDAASFWADEAFTGEWLHRPLVFLWTEGLVVETTPPLYYMLLKGWAALAGDGDFSLRLFSALASTLTIPLVWRLALALAPGPGLAPGPMLAALVFALAPMQVAYSQEARVYTLIPLAFTLALLGLVRFIRAARAGRAGWWPVALFALGAVLLVYVHATSVFTVAALGLVGLVLLRRAGRAALGRFIGALLGVAVLSVPELFAILQQAGRSDLDWVTPPDLVGLLNLLTHLLIDPVTPLTLFRLSCLVAGALALLLLATVPFLRIGTVALALLLGVPALFLAAVIGVSLLSPFLIPRIIIWTGVPVAVLAGLGLASAAPLALRAGLGVALAGCVWLGLGGVYVRTLAEKEDWRGFMAAALPALAAGGQLVIGPNTSMLPMLRYSAGAFAGTGRRYYRFEPRPWHADLYLPSGVLPAVPLDTLALAAAVRDGHGVWLVMRLPDWGGIGPAALPAGMPPASMTRDWAGLQVVRW